MSQTTTPWPKLRVVVVDDEDLVRLPVVAILQDAGADIVEFASPSQALADFAGLPCIDLVLTDVNMPDMDGVTFAQLLRTRHPHVPVIFMSGQGRPPGAAHFIAKPFGQADLLTAIGRVLGTRKGAAAAS
jgi:CheY-like chemotaxis protein